MHFHRMDDFQEICKQKLIDWYHKYKHIELNGGNVYVVWSFDTPHD